MKPSARNRPNGRSMRKARRPSTSHSSTASAAVAAVVRSAAIGIRSKWPSITLVTGTLAPQLAPTNSMAANAPARWRPSLTTLPRLRGRCRGNRRMTPPPPPKTGEGMACVCSFLFPPDRLVADPAVAVDVGLLGRDARLDHAGLGEAEVEDGVDQRLLQIEVPAAGERHDAVMHDVVVQHV